MRRNAARDSESDVLKQINPNAYRKFYGNIRTVEKEQDTIEIEQDETLHIYGETHLKKHLQVASVDEERFVRMKGLVLDKLSLHLQEAMDIIDIFAPLQDLVDGSLVNYTIHFINQPFPKKNKGLDYDLMLQQYNIKVKELRRIERLVRKVPNAVFFSMFEVDCSIAKNQLLNNILALKNQVFLQIENQVIHNFKQICAQYDEIEKTLHDSLQSADDVVAMETYKNSLVVDLVVVLEKCNQNRKLLFYLVDIDHCVGEVAQQYTKQIYEWPSKLTKILEE